MVNWIDDIQKISKNMQIQYKHILREGNKLEYALTNHTLDKDNIKYHSFEDMVHEQRKILNSDISYLGIRTKKDEDIHNYYKSIRIQ